jgi:hypothetical protein
MATAGGAGDATELDGRYIDRSGYLSAKLTVAFKAVLGDGETLSIAANLQDDADGAGVGTDFGGAFASAVVATGPGGGGTVEGQVELDFDLSGARQYVRAQFTPDLSAANTDTAIIAAVLVLGGADEIPAS